jgi:hypothetical protein
VGGLEPTKSDLDAEKWSCGEVLLMIVCRRQCRSRKKGGSRWVAVEESLLEEELGNG